ncbi:RuvX/YqgF family protein [Neorickettsia sennetsu]|uniref:Pre-16S rRNA nuclease n=1 Tax=Ehrlichia sennetsu (strain ATCC VR-367 / Miyayama) TaxID=222891 RepID=Q2GF04_EHRS3|nr:RuvX/YqgF family protein [Neorickettsia sennetsu]ABD46308.1 conserved hypothetical protein [Neorickettsia sennetsu str. Miyayama]
MITFDLQKFLGAIEAGRVISIDPGRRIVGVAVSDPELRYIQNYFQFTSHGRGADAFHIMKVVSDFSGIIVGTPFSHIRNNGWLDFIDKFAQKLSEVTRKPILMCDESSSTSDVMILLSSLSRSRQKEWKDKIAACCILEKTLCTIMHHNLCHQRRFDSV